MRLTRSRNTTPPDPTLDPVRRRKPGGRALLRLTTVAALLATAATLTWSGAATCLPARDPAQAPPLVARQVGGPFPEPGRSAFPAGDGSNPPEAPTPASHPAPPEPGSDSGSSSGPGSRSGPGSGADGIETPPGTTSRLAAPPGTVGVPVRLSEPAALRLVRAGNRIDLFSTGATAELIAEGALVLEVTGADDPLTGGLLVALAPATAKEAVRHATGGYAAVIRPDR